VLIAVALALLVWRPHSTPTLPKPDVLAASLANAPKAALAIVTGNAQLAKQSTPVATVSVPTPIAAPVKAEPEHAEFIAPPSITIERPRVAKPDRVATTVRNIVVPAALRAPSLDLAEPEATGLSTPDVSEVDASIQPTRIVSPIYPQRAKMSGIEGNVKLEFGIAADGTVSDIKVVKAMPTGVFDAAAITALKQWHFAASSDQRYVRDFAFVLQHDATDEPCVQPTGTMICRRPADYSPNRTIINERH
jgi:protein TonB